MNFWKQILTGSNNDTIAIGRVFGLILMVMVILEPIVEMVTVAWRKIEIETWGQMLAQWQVFLPVMVVTAAGMIAGTAFTEPKAGGGQ